MRFIDYLLRQIIWSRATFGPGRRTEGILQHMEKEIAEVRESNGDPSEWVDLVILALDGLWRSCMYKLVSEGGELKRNVDDTAEFARVSLYVKQEKNEDRIWPAWQTRTQDEPIEHDRSHDL